MCAYCDGERGVPSHWGMAPEGWARMKEDHDAGHPNRDKVNQALSDIVDSLEVQAGQDLEAGKDAAHDKLMYDIGALNQDAALGLFHDFHKNGLATPKLALIQRLEKLVENVKEGRYDN